MYALVNSHEPPGIGGVLTGVTIYGDSGGPVIDQITIPVSDWDFGSTALIELLYARGWEYVAPCGGATRLAASVEPRWLCPVCGGGVTASLAASSLLGTSTPLNAPAELDCLEHGCGWYGTTDDIPDRVDD